MIDIYFRTYDFIKINYDEINFKFIKLLPKISTPNYKTELYNYLKNLIIKNLDKIKESKLLQIFEENEIYQFNSFEDVILSEDFYGTDDLLKIIYPNNEYFNFPEYIKLKKFKDAKLDIKSIQTFENKLFIHQQNSDNFDNYFFYFSFGTINNLEQINWKNELKIYVDEIKNIFLLNEKNKIILAGHSIGSIVIQYLALELIKNEINLNNVFLIGSGCILSNLLTDEEINLIKLNFKDRYHFILASYVKNNILYFDSKDNTNKINKIITHLLVNDYNQSYQIPINKIYENNQVIIKSTNEIILHDFSNYLKLRNSIENIEF
jgi:hypothetical protein